MINLIAVVNDVNLAGNSKIVAYSGVADTVELKCAVCG